MWLPVFLALALASLCAKTVESSHFSSQRSSRGTCQIGDGESFLCTIEYTEDGCKLIDDEGKTRIRFTALRCSERSETPSEENKSVIRGNEGVFSVISDDCM